MAVITPNFAKLILAPQLLQRDPIANLSPINGLVADTRSEADGGGRNITRFLLREEHAKNQSAPQRKLFASVRKTRL
jgi:hypothetical protein